MKEVVSVAVLASKEGFNVYDLADGHTIKMKTVVLDVVRVEGVKDELGNPVYHVQHRVLMTAAPTEAKGE
ncbi:MAG: hypothetical protein HUU15_06535 [Candidatus Brocadiae bacterium]|nr:hypothetical protein [Candidatus Brocadiia bacterium]